MATINLLPRKVFEITLSDGTVITGQYGTWASRRICDKMQIGLVELGNKIQNADPVVLMDHILAAVEFTSRELKHGFSYTDLDVARWIDEIGGFEGEDFIKLYQHSQGTVSTAEEEKKTEAST